MTSGTLADARLSVNVPLKNAVNSFTEQNNFGFVYVADDLQVDGSVTAGAVAGGTISGTLSGNGSAVTALNATNIASGALADARLSSNIPLKNAANVFTGYPQTVQHDDPDYEPVIPYDGSTLLNGSAASAANYPCSPARVWANKQWIGGVSRDVKAAMFQIPSNFNSAILRVASMNPLTGVWAAVFDFPQNYEFGLQEGTCYGAMLFNAVTTFASGVYVTDAAGSGRIGSLQREGATNVLLLRSTGTQERIKATDSSTNFTPFVAREIRASAGASPSGFSAGFKGNAALAADRTWTLPLVDAAGIFISDGAGVLSFLANGAEGYVLKIASGVPAWVAP